MQRLRRLMGRRSFRTSERCFVAEGTKVLREALAAGVTIESVYVDPGAASPDVEVLASRCLEAGSRVFDLAPGVLSRLGGTISPQPVLAVVAALDVSMDDLAASRPQVVVVCVDVRDPGNAGTLLRSAHAAGADGVICCDGSVDVYNPKTVRASAGAVFHVPLVVGPDPASVLEALSRWGMTRIGAAARRGRDYTGTDLCRRIAVVVGNEAAGVPVGLEGSIDEWMSIPMAGSAESLNVGTAAAVICFEAARQRRSRPAVAARR